MAIIIAPPHLRESYGNNEKQYIDSGKKDFDIMMFSVKLPSKPCILEIGCATGRILRYFLPQVINHGWEVHGSDIIPEYITWGKNNLPWFKWINAANTNEYSFYDFIYAQSVFTHIPSPETTILHFVNSKLKPKGQIFITIHDHISIENLKKNKFPNMTEFCKNKISIKHFWVKDRVVLGEELAHHCKVFYNREFFINMIEKFGFKLTKIIERAHRDDQTGLLFRKK